MILLQFGIGIVNDVVDAPRDAGRKAGKPIPAGLVPAGPAVLVALGSFAAGTILGALVGLPTGLLALVVIAIGLAYDLRLKGTAWSWLPFALGIPILPVFGWLGATGGLHPAFAILLPAAVVGGAGLAIGNSLIDIERDVAAGQTSVAARLGRGPAIRIDAGLMAGLALAAVVSVGGGSGGLAVGAFALVAVVAAILPEARPDLAEWAWRLQAVSLAGLAIVWIAIVLR
jgi:4-hydroxybenzoate polyprenyltransferase